MYAKLGEEFLVLLPEIIPFLAELMEDRLDRKEGGKMGCEGGYGRSIEVLPLLLAFANR